MTSPIGWDDYKRWCFIDPVSRFRLDASRIGLSAAFVDSLRPRLEHAFEEMNDLERGALANPDEQRMVGHYWLRAPELSPSPEIGDAIRQTGQRISEFVRRVLDGDIRTEGGERFRRQLVIGIGGSALGPQFVADALGGRDDRLPPDFLDNTDPDGIDRVLARLGEELAHTLTIVISKSGGTPETRNGMLETRAAYAERNLDFGAHAVAITGAESRLDRYAAENGFLDRFPMWDWVGGRTSETSAVGLLPASLQGIDVGAMLAGAAAMDALTRSTDPLRNPAALLALGWFKAGEGRGTRDMVILPYKDRLALFSRYLQQLVMESLGKQHDLEGNVVHQGIAVYGNKGSTDQHAYVQQLRDGLPNFFVTFIEVLRDRIGKSLEVEDGVTSGDFLQGFLLGTRQALFDSGRASLTVTVEDVTPYSVGQLIALYERAVGLYASLVRVNAYHQPGVEAGKRAAAAILTLQRRLLDELDRRAGKSATVEELARALDTGPRTETLFQLLERLASDPTRRVRREVGPTPFSASYRLE